LGVSEADFAAGKDLEAGTLVLAGDRGGREAREVVTAH
jgi:hypothetical protein